MGRHRRQDRERPQRPGAPSSSLERAQQGEVRERARAEEEAVHPAVDAVEEERPARGEDHRGEQGGHSAGEPRGEQRDDREAGDGEESRNRPESRQAEAEVRDDPGEQEVERRAAALLEHDLEQVAERVAADEERQRLVLVRRPGEELVEEEAGRCGRRRPRLRAPNQWARDPRARSGSLSGSETLCLCGIAHRCRQFSLLAFGAMPIYEYRCPDGHTFEVFQRFADAPIEKCEICGKSPVEKVLYPVSVHFKGSGFYSTDYGRGGRKKTRALEGRRAATRAPSEKKSDSDSGAGEKKAAAARLESTGASYEATRRRRSCPGGGGCGAERPVNIAIAAVFSSVPTMTDWPPMD